MPPADTDRYLKNVDTVFLFGAGTSAHMRLSQSEDSACVPTDTSFFDVVKDGVLEKWCTQKILSTAQQARERVFAALRHAGVKKDQLFKQPGSDCPQVRLEELFCRLEMLRMLGRYVLMRLDSEWKEAWKHPSDALRDLIAIVMAHGRPTGADLRELGYMDFVGRILTRQEEKKANTYAVLTLNYEIGLECAIKGWYDHDHSTFRGVRAIAQTLQEKGIYPHVELRSLFHYALPHRPAPQTPEAVPVLKLHGSCNWGFCPECENAFHLNIEEGPHGFGIDRLAGRPDERHVCALHSADRPLSPKYVSHIVPPTWNKWMGDYTMRHIWRQAYGVLRICRKLFVIGTSLPETDPHLSHLFRVAFAQKKQLPEVYIVNPITQDERSDYKRRAEETVGMTTVGMTIPEQNCLWQSFEEKDTVEKKDTVGWIFERVQQPTR